MMFNPFCAHFSEVLNAASQKADVISRILYKAAGLEIAGTATRGA